MNSPELQELTAQIILRMEENTPRIEKCLAELSEEEVWQHPNPASNSVGNLILHLCGNITQYAISSLGNRPDARDRDAEFAAEGGFSKAELMEKLDWTVREAVETIRRADREELLRVRAVQGFDMSGIGIIVHVCEHYSYHTGQIAFWTKLLKSKDLGFYAGVDLTVKNG
ncbi:MAG: DUF1572 domain-containing protein [Haliscomenobacteraceae bacterium CHB4]|nr:hypothetical protein [Saprospiraceae bacterium]MCE7922397.1 DUF1572 domain-containing protein [Haliscomenobacteraceae bacterium CHB4]